MVRACLKSPAHPHPPFRPPPTPQGDRAVVEEYQEKVAVASRKAEKVVRQFEELGAGG